MSLRIAKAWEIFYFLRLENLLKYYEMISFSSKKLERIESNLITNLEISTVIFFSSVLIRESISEHNLFISNSSNLKLFSKAGLSHVAIS